MEENRDGAEKQLKQLLNAVKKNLSPSERREVEDFIADNEFEAALEALVDILVEKPEPLTKQAFDLAKKVASALELGGELARITKNLAPKKA